MSFTGRYFDLYSNWYFDDRMDPEKSTEAACRYLSQLYSMFHNWELTLAAYNSGPGTVKRAIRRSGYKKTFWELYNYLPRETRSYVPQFISIIYSMNYAEEHNMVEPALEEMIPHDTLHVRKFLHLDTFAKLTGTCTEELLQLNPSVRHNAIPESTKSFVLKLPIAAKAELEKYRITILDSASKAGRKEVEILAKNAIGNIAGRDLVVYFVKNGDVLGTIAQRYHVRVDDLRKWNNLRGNIIRTGQRINIWALPSKRVSQSVTKPGSVQVTAVPWTNLKSDRLEQGMKLI